MNTDKNLKRLEEVYQGHQNRRLLDDATVAEAEQLLGPHNTTAEERSFDHLIELPRRLQFG